MSNIKVLGVDLAKNVFQVHGSNVKGKQVLSKRLNRAKLIEFVSNLSPCLIGLEASTGAHYWGRLFEQCGHTVKIMAPQFVKPYVKSNKNDYNDARGIAEAVTRPDMKFVPIKRVDQQETLLLHRARELAVKHRIAQGNQIRGCLAEFGVVIPQGVTHIRKLPIILEQNAEKLTVKIKAVFLELYEQYILYDRQEKGYQKQIEQQAAQDVQCREIMKIEGIGPLTASAIVATIGDAKAFKNGREVSAWLGLVPKQHSSGNKIRLLGISKRGDQYVRKLLIQGARSAVKNCGRKIDKKNKWIADKKNRCGYNKAAVAVANKNARIVWAVMATGECYRQSALI